MTDKEVIKALECCTTNGASCKDCPAFVKVDRSNCKKYFRGALDLINRQQAEIERLTKETMNMAVIIETCQTDFVEVVRCKDCNKRNGFDCPISRTLSEHWFTDNNYCSYGEKNN